MTDAPLNHLDSRIKLVVHIWLITTKYQNIQLAKNFKSLKTQKYIYLSSGNSTIIFKVFGLILRPFELDNFPSCALMKLFKLQCSV